MKIAIKDCVKVLGRGTVILCTPPEELFEYLDDFCYACKIKTGDIITINNLKYTIHGVEKLTTSKSVGLVINGVEDCKKFIGKYFEYLK